ncbi:isoleucine--tRNA ligase, cytoplasmic-like [Episyrphus balteatus]|uniref:isoleucine--tRNA ligase, cytoplasmic-like n=1 Tax=Episyrphus balteatus TaxID=286459 RepID=UPI0024856658|nr:isoleucine--tRNA ligase, cytoplasmic-like [Episyrphus balteatus]
MFQNRNEFTIPDYLNFPSAEQEILTYWKENNIFEQIQQERRQSNSGCYSFYDGPPFATGLPHYGHILAGTIKDIVGRYATQKNLLVERRFGWDCHGLPVEHEIDKKLNIKGPKDVQAMGIAKYNLECRQIVQRYSDEWKTTVEKSGRWVDFDNDYKTMYPSYMESVWWVFKQLFDKGLVYRGIKVMPFSTACCTPLSNFESTQNYKDVTDTSVTIALNVVDSNEKLLIWTTTPWTLPSNLAVCVNPKMIYVKVKPLAVKDDIVYILSGNRLQFVFKDPSDYIIIEEFPGSSLKDLSYEPLFDYFSDYRQKSGAFRVLLDNYVTDDSGTGIVHQAPFFGEDDHRVCLANGVITKSSKIVCPIDDCGRFTEDVPDFVGLYIKDADPLIISKLKEHGHVIQISQIIHSYPFCWRSDTPLIYKAVPSWFIRVEKLTDQLLANNAQTQWVPDVVKEKRFANWLKNARDWAISRNRYWGTPIPIWSSPSGAEIRCIGSIADLQRLSGVDDVKDLHREFIDDLEFPSKIPGNPPLRRIPEVFDCWFESGAMPYAQQHYPFENKEHFEKIFPADFIAEGIDQTRGWFYTLLALSTALFNKPPFKNVIVNGLVLAADGSKISKRKKNYQDPETIMDKYGADALRLYLINSNLVKGGDLCFKEEGVKNIIKTVFLPWYNAFRFCILNIDKDSMFSKITDKGNLSNIMDRWILSYTESLVEFFEMEMQAYRLYTVLPKLIKFIEQLTNWYIRLNRSRLKNEEGDQNRQESLNVLTHVLAKLSIVMAPFAPFFSEYVYQRLALFYKFDGGKKSSVHSVLIPKINHDFIQPLDELSVARMQIIIDLGRVLRERNVIPLKYPVAELVIVHLSEDFLNELERMKEIILKELNVRKIRFTTDRQEFGASFKAQPNFQILGQKYKNEFKIMMKEIKNLSDGEIEKGLKEKRFEVNGHEISLEEIQIAFAFKKNNDTHFESISQNDVLIFMDFNKSEELFEEGTAREIINRIQKLKKKAKLQPSDKVLVVYETKEESLQKIILKYYDFIHQPTQSEMMDLEGFQSLQKSGEKIIQDDVDIKGLCMRLHLYYEH